MTIATADFEAAIETNQAPAGRCTNLGHGEQMNICLTHHVPCTSTLTLKGTGSRIICRRIAELSSGCSHYSKEHIKMHQGKGLLASTENPILAIQAAPANNSNPSGGYPRPRGAVNMIQKMRPPNRLLEIITRQVNLAIQAPPPTPEYLDWSDQYIGFGRRITLTKSLDQVTHLWSSIPRSAGTIAAWFSLT
jgi:hypothetical protein